MKNLAMWAIIVLLSVGLFNVFQNPDKIKSAKNNIAFSEFLSEVDDGRVVEVVIQGNNINGVLANGTNFKTYSPNYPNLVEKLSDKGVNIVATPLEDKMPSLKLLLQELYRQLSSSWEWLFQIHKLSLLPLCIQPNLIVMTKHP